MTTTTLQTDKMSLTDEESQFAQNSVRRLKTLLDAGASPFLLTREVTFLCRVLGFYPH